MLETPERTYVPEQTMPRRTSVTPRGKLRRDFDDDFEDDFEEVGVRSSRGRVVPSKWRRLPTTLWGRVAAGAVLLVGAGLCVAFVLAVRGWVLHDERFVIPSSSAIEIAGNEHLTRAQLLSIFGGDVERNVFTVSLPERKAELERLPWVQHATVMRLLPDHLRVSIAERTPVAFVREGGRIGLVDAGGILLDMPADVKESMHYSFPVITGIRAEDPISTRAARMKLYRSFLSDMDSGGEKISEQLSEVDLSNPEDVKALIPDKPVDILVHFGDTDFLERYHKYKAHLAEWRTQYPRLASVDMRYEQQAVLEMQPGSEAAAAGSTAKAGMDVKPVAPVKPVSVKAAPVAAALTSGAPVAKASAVVKAGAGKVAGSKAAGKAGAGHAVALKPTVPHNKRVPGKPVVAPKSVAVAKPAATSPKAVATAPKPGAAGAKASVPPAGMASTAGGGMVQESHWVTPGKSTPDVKGKNGAKGKGRAGSNDPDAGLVQATGPSKAGRDEHGVEIIH